MGSASSSSSSRPLRGSASPTMTRATDITIQRAREPNLIMRSADFESHAPYTDTAQSKPRRSSQSSTAKSAEWVPSQDPSLALRTAPRTHHEVQQAANSDSGHNSSQSSPSSPGGSTVGK